MTRREGLAYAAGLFNGEGSTVCAVEKTGQHHLHLKVAQSYDPEVLYEFLAAVEVGTVYGPYEGPKQKYDFRASGHEDVQSVVAKLWPWLSTVKRQQATRALKKWRTWKFSLVNYNTAKTHCPAGHEYTDDNTYRYGTHRQCKACKVDRRIRAAS